MIFLYIHTCIFISKIYISLLIHPVFYIFPFLYSIVSNYYKGLTFISATKFSRDLTFYKMTGSKYNLSFIFRSFENHADEIILKIYTHNFTQFRLIFST